MRLRLILVVLAAALAWSGPCGDASAQNKVRTETIRPPASPDPNSKPNARAVAPDPQAPVVVPDIMTNLARLPAPVARTRERILAAAQSGDLQKLVGLMQSNETMPVFTFTED